MTQKAFTLVELLVVISIVALLLALLLPALSGARAEAQAIACLSNVKQIGVGMATYSNDFQGYVPATNTIANITTGGFPAWNISFGSGWVSRLARGSYVETTFDMNQRKRDAFTCRLDRTTVYTSNLPYYSSYRGISLYYSLARGGVSAPAYEYNFNTKHSIRAEELYRPAMEYTQPPMTKNSQVYPLSRPPKRFPLLTEAHDATGMTHDPWGSPFSFNNLTATTVPHPQFKRATLMNDFSGVRMDVAWNTPMVVYPGAVRFYFPGNF